jgi:enoyl-CoA hydratase/carnithine racemase
MSKPEITLEKHGQIASLTIDRPERKNAMSQAMWTLLAEKVDLIANDPEIRAVLVKGQAGVFCAGADISEFKQLAESPDRLRENNQIVQLAQEKLEELARPTIAVIDGPCIGGGMGIAMCCDFRLTSESSVFAITPAKLGLLYSKRDTRRLLALVGPSNAKDILYTGRKLNSSEASSMGLINQILPTQDLEETALNLAKQLCLSSQYSIRGTKDVIAHLEGYKDLSDDTFQTLFDDAFIEEDCVEGVAAFKEKRAPVFTWS